MGLNHWKMVYEHEKDAYGCGLKSVLSSLMRFSVAKLMTGSVDNYYIPVEGKEGKLQLVAWTQTIIKGDTLRGKTKIYETVREVALVEFFMRKQRKRIHRVGHQFYARRVGKRTVLLAQEE